MSLEMLERNPKQYMEVLQHFIVLRAEMLITTHCIEYQAFSPLFRELQEGDQYPNYELVWHEDEHRLEAFEQDAPAKQIRKIRFGGPKYNSSLTIQREKSIIPAEIFDDSFDDEIPF